MQYFSSTRGKCLLDIMATMVVRECSFHLGLDRRLSTMAMVLQCTTHPRCTTRLPCTTRLHVQPMWCRSTWSFPVNSTWIQGKSPNKAAIQKCASCTTTTTDSNGVHVRRGSNTNARPLSRVIF